MRPEVDRPIGRGWAAALPPLRRDPHPLDCLRLKNFLAGRFSVKSQAASGGVLFVASCLEQLRQKVLVKGYLLLGCLKWT